MSADVADITKWASYRPSSTSIQPWYRCECDLV